ncbi:unnamed protein product [Paramecium primaurelia]|uniref:Uncharacterized protein n=1 Tax=Paramecium primaurelia TaxID=5886 RepID=A0A8S1N1X5_PARPR|nr:unnamed protein product [Paramecium primaurelia]
MTQKGKFRNGKKIGQWNILNKEDKMQQILYKLHYYNLGVGVDPTIYQVMKQRLIWVKVNEQFKDNFQITQKGEYKNGKKSGQWNILIKQKQIGGGCYDENKNNIQIGKLIEVTEQFKDDSQVTYIGEYKDGQKLVDGQIRIKGSIIFIHFNINQWWWII